MAYPIVTGSPAQPVFLVDPTTGLPYVAGGGSGSLPVTIADGADVAEGATTAVAYSDATGATAGTVVGLLKGNYVTSAAFSAKLPASLGPKTGATSLSVVPASDAAFVLGAGTALIGKVGIDQTTPGTTNAVVATGNVASGATDSGNPLKAAGKYNSTLPTFTDGQRGDLQIASTGELQVFAKGNLTTGADGINNVNLISIGARGSAGSATISPLNVASYGFDGGAWDRIRFGNLTSRLVSSANSTNSTLVKNAVGWLFNLFGYNSTAAVIYLKLYNKASAPTIGTDTPVLTLACPPTSAFAFDLLQMYFSTGIGFGLTTGSADADTGAVAAGASLGLNVVYA